MEQYTEIANIQSELQAEKAKFQNLNSFKEKIKNHSKDMVEKIASFDQKNKLLEAKLLRLKTERTTEKKNQGYINQLKDTLINNPADQKIIDIEKLIEENNNQKKHLEIVKNNFNSRYLNLLFNYLSSNKDFDIKSSVKDIKDIRDNMIKNLAESDPPQLREDAEALFLYLNSHIHSKLLERVLQRLETTNKDKTIDMSTKLEQYSELLSEIDDIHQTNQNKNLEKIYLKMIDSIQNQMAKELSEGILKQIENIHQNKQINSSRKIEKYFEVLNHMNDIQKTNGNDAIKQAASKTIVAIQNQIAQELNQFSNHQLSLRNMLSHGEQHYDNELQIAYSIRETLEKNEQFLNNVITSANADFKKNIALHDNLKKHHGAFEKLNSLIINMQSDHANTQHKHSLAPIAEIYQGRFGAPLFLKTIQSSKRKGDLEFLQTIIDLLAKDTHMLPANKAAILLGALNHFEHTLHADHFTVGINNFKKMINQTKTECFSEIKQKTRQLYQLMEEESKNTLKKFVQAHEAKFHHLHVAQKLISTEHMKMHQFQHKKAGKPTQRASKLFSYFNRKK